MVEIISYNLSVPMKTCFSAICETFALGKIEMSMNEKSRQTVKK